ncbi:MAG: ATP-dependent helicase [Mycoplasma sp.]
MINLNELNHNQKAAVTSDLNPALVIAGAGSGKTKVLTMRYAYLMQEYNLKPEEILAITFTNKAANEMKTRLVKILGNQNFKWIGTFHSICLKILRADIQHLNRANDFSVIDDEDQIRIFREAYKMNMLMVKDLPYQQIFFLLDKYKTEKLTIADIKSETNWKWLHIKNNADAINKSLIIDYYEKFCLKSNLLDFNDLLIMTNKLFEVPQVKEKWAKEFKSILVDEFQDTNDEQYKFIKSLSSLYNSIFVVGDPDQTIYTWRGARPEIITNFANEFKGTKTYILDQNYRSTQKILDTANSLIKNNTNRIEKDLKAAKGDGLAPIYFRADSQDGESRWIANKILTLLESKVNPNDICILYRANYLSRNIEQELISNNIKYNIFGGVKFYQRKEIKDIISYLKTLYVGDELSIKRVINTPRRGVGDAAIDALTDFAISKNTTFLDALYRMDEIDGLSRTARNGIVDFIQILSTIDINQSLANIFDLVIEKTKYIEYLKDNEEYNKIENINELRSAIQKFELENPESSNLDYLQEISLYTDANTKHEDGINLMTVHTAKGLEYDNVFLIGLNEGTFPSKQSSDSTEGLEEERRIAYVGVTRAQRQLYLSSYGGVNFITKTENVKSRFVDEFSSKNIINESLSYKKISNTQDSWYDSSAKKINISENYNTNNDVAFKIGDQLVHTVFGSGYVLSVKGTELSVLFKPPYNKKTVISNHKSVKRLLN